MSVGARVGRAMAPLRAAVETGRIPGGALGLVTAEGERAVAWCGQAQVVPEARPVARGTVWDLASLTKVLFTTERVLALVEDGTVALDDPLTRLIPDLRQYDGGAWERRVTFRDCLLHRTAFPAVWPIYTYGADPATLRAFVLQRPWPAGGAVYSDLNFILLGIALERHHGLSIRGMDPGPGFTWSPDPRATAATERCSWRGRVMVGEVHDENAWALQGSGHAGLFGTADAVLDAAAALLRRPADHPVRQRLHGTRTHGWEARHEGWSGGDAASPGAIGHTGFTGTGLWIDPARGHAWTLLTNRVHPSRHADSGIVPLRRAVGDLISGGA